MKKSIKVVAGIIKKDDKIMICQRSSKEKYYPLHWEFPGGKAEENETDEQALARELKEELNISVDVGDYFITSIIKDKNFEISFYFINNYLGNIELQVHNDMKWINVSQLQEYEFPEADNECISELEKRYKNE